MFQGREIKKWYFEIETKGISQPPRDRRRRNVMNERYKRPYVRLAQWHYGHYGIMASWHYDGMIFT
jgi:hypothetical protein